MRKIFTTRRRIALAAAGGALALAIGTTAAYAYFTSTGSGNGSATVGTAGTWEVSAAAPTGGPLYPGTGTETIVFTVTNSGSGSQEFTTATPTVPVYEATTDAETTGGDDITGCTASWFSVSVLDDPGAGTEIPAGQSAEVTVTVQLTDESVSQDSCESASPDVELSIS